MLTDVFFDDRNSAKLMQTAYVVSSLKVSSLFVISDSGLSELTEEMAIQVSH